MVVFGHFQLSVWLFSAI